MAHRHVGSDSSAKGMPCTLGPQRGCYGSSTQKTRKPGLDNAKQLRAPDRIDNGPSWKLWCWLHGFHSCIARDDPSTHFWPSPKWVNKMTPTKQRRSAGPVELPRLDFGLFIFAFGSESLVAWRTVQLAITVPSHLQFSLHHGPRPQPGLSK